jgi:hypothetical protein
MRLRASPPTRPYSSRAVEVASDSPLVVRNYPLRRFGEGTGTKVSPTSTKDFDEEHPCIDRSREEGQHSAAKDPIQPTS